MKNNRRSFLKGAGVALGVAGGASLPVTTALAQSATTSPSADTVQPVIPGYQSLSLEESAITEAMVEHMWPADDLGPSGVDIGIATFIDRQLAGGFGRGDRLYSSGPFRQGKPQHGYQLPLTPEQYYKLGIAGLNAYSKLQHGKTFDRLANAERESVLTAVAAGDANTPELNLASWFNELFYPLFNQGAFSDPIYGGNRDKAGWKLIGYPGLPAVYNRDILTYRNQRNPKSDAPKSIQDLS